MASLFTSVTLTALLSCRIDTSVSDFADTIYLRAHGADNAHYRAPTTITSLRCRHPRVKMSGDMGFETDFLKSTPVLVHMVNHGNAVFAVARQPNAEVRIDTCVTHRWLIAAVFRK